MEKRQYDELRVQQNEYWWFRGKREIVLDFASTQAGLAKNSDSCLLDVGCGMGLMLETLKEYGRVFGMDFEEEAVKYCNETFCDAGEEPRVLRGALPDNVPFEKHSFDYIFALDVLEHIEDDRNSLITLRECLKENGKLIITVPANMSLWSYNDELNHHVRRYEKQELIDKVQNAGFRIIKCSFYNSLLYPAVWAVRHLKNAFKVQTTDVNNVGGLFNGVLKRLFVTEKYRLRKKGFKHGVSLIMACEINKEQAGQ